MAKGADALSGGGGADLLIGGQGQDALTGGLGADTFRFLAKADTSKTAALADIVLDFAHGEGDLLDLSAIEADLQTAGNQAFTLTGAFTHTAGELIQTSQGGAWLVQADINGDAKADLAILVHAAVALVQADFLL